MNELPDRAVIDLDTARGQFADQPAQGELTILDPIQQPSAVLARNRLWLMPAHLAGSHTPGLAQTGHPANCAADTHPELLGCFVTRQHVAFHRRNHAFAKILRVWLAHPSWPPSSRMVNQKPPDLGIPNRFRLTSSRF